MKINYFYSSKINLFIKYLTDLVGYYCFNRNKSNLIIDFKRIKSIAIVNLGHIGDMILMLPMLDSLRRGFDGKITLIINPYVYELVEHFNMIDDIIVVDHPKVSRKNKSSWFNTVLTFNRLKFDLVFNADMLFYSIPLCYLIKCKYFIGYNAGGFGFLFDKVLEYPYGQHITERYFRFIDYLNLVRIKPKKLDCYLKVNLSSYFLGFKKHYNIDGKFAVIAIGTGAQSKDWDDKNYIELLEKILFDLKIKVVLLGKINFNREMYYKNSLKYFKDSCIVNLINKTSIIEAISLIYFSNFFIGLDSGLTHVAGMCGVKTFGIYSGMTGVGVWDPISLNNNVNIIKVEVPCNNDGNGCGKTVCKNNICMKNIKPEMVYDFIIKNI